MAYAHPVYHGGKNYSEQVTDEYLRCFLCKIPGYKEARMLLCGHSFCLNCIEAYMQSRGLPLEGGACVHCPQCGLATRVPRGGPARLKENLFVNIQVDRLLRRHNQERGRDDTWYNISQYTQNNPLDRAILND